MHPTLAQALPVMVALSVFFLALTWVSPALLRRARAGLAQRPRPRLPPGRVDTGCTVARWGCNQKKPPPSIRLRRTAGEPTKLMIISCQLL